MFCEAAAKGLWAQSRMRPNRGVKVYVCVHLWVALLVTCTATEITKEGGKICRSMDIRNKVQALQRLSGCRVVEGFVRVVLIDRANETDYNTFSFPELHEITDYLLVYRVAGLTSLGKLFPNLTVIRGNSLFVDYALVVYEMFQLQVRKPLINGLLSNADMKCFSVIIYASACPRHAKRKHNLRQLLGRGYISVRNAALLTLRLERVSERLLTSEFFL
jgi:hypothetical protein